MEKKRKKQIIICPLSKPPLKQVKSILQTKNILNKNTLSIYNPPYESLWFETENKVSLESYIKHLFSIAKKHLKSNVHPDTIKGIFVPIAGIKYSGLCSASSYSQILGKTQDIKRIILLCTNHEPANSFVSTSYTDIASYNNNKSVLKIDTNTIEYLKPYLQIDNKRFNNEQSFFNQLPFIEHIALKNDKNILILPFLISNNINLLDENTRNNIRIILHKIIGLLKQQDTIIVCSSDLSHINGNYEHKINSYIYQNIREKDNEILQFLYNGLHGINERNQKLDDILFIQNAPSRGTLAIYFFAKILYNYSGELDFSSSSSSSSSSSLNSNDSRSPNINTNIIWNNKNIKQNFEINILRHLFPRVCCYYTSLMRNKINIYNFNPLELNKVLNIVDTNESSESYAGLIFTTQPYIELNKFRNIENILSEYEKIAIKGLVKEQLYNDFNINNISKIPAYLITTINCNVLSNNLGFYLSIYKNDKLRACVGTNDNDNDNDNYNNEEFTLLNNIKRFTKQLTLQKTKYKGLEFKIIEPSEYNNLSFNITFFNHIKPITINNYLKNYFEFGQDALFMEHNKNKNNQEKYLYSLTNIDINIDENDNNNDDNDDNDDNDNDNDNDYSNYSNYDDIEIVNNNFIKKKNLLESLCNIQFNKINNKYYEMNIIKLYYSEGYNF